MILGTEGSHSSDYQLSVHTGYLTVKGEAEHYLWGSCLWAGTLRVHAHVLQNMGMSWSDLYWNDDGSFYRIKRCLRISERCIKKRKESRFDEGTEACAIPCTSRSFFFWQFQLCDYPLVPMWSFDRWLPAVHNEWCKQELYVHVVFKNFHGFQISNVKFVPKLQNIFLENSSTVNCSLCVPIVDFEVWLELFPILGVLGI